MATSVGHCYRCNDEMASRTNLWQPVHGRTSQGRPALCNWLNIDLRKDVELEPGELNMEMRDGDVWRQTVGASRMSE